MSSFEEWPAAQPGAMLWRVTTGDDDPGQHRVIPDGVMDIVSSGNTLLFAGADTRENLTASAPGTVTWGIRLPPGLAHGVLGIPAHELTDGRFDLHDLARLPGSIVEEVDRSPAAGLEQIVAHLTRRAVPEPDLLRLASSVDRAARTGMSTREIAARHNLSERSLRRFSSRVFGYGVKSLSSIHRLQAALELVRSGAPLVEAAARARFADQAHLSREAKRLTGLTVGQLTR